MALIKCPECNQEISNHASHCPNCGCPIEIIKAEMRSIQKKKIKRSIPIFIFVVIVLLCCIVAYDSSQPFDDISADFIDGLKEVYGEPTSDKSETSDGNTNIWLEWSNDNSKISYFYSFNDNKYNLVLAYELPENKVPTIDTSDRNGDFRSGFWGDDIDTIYKCETAKFATVSDDNKTIMYSGTVAGHEAYILYDFDDEGKLYRGLYQFTDSYNEGSIVVLRVDTESVLALSASAVLVSLTKFLKF